MTVIDQALARWRIAKAGRHIPQGSQVLDVGCADGTLFSQLDERLTGGVGIDACAGSWADGLKYRFVNGTFPEDLPDVGPFDAITMLAVLEHVPPDEQARWASTCARLLVTGGRLVVTVPAPSADHVLDGLRAVRLLEGMELHQHYGFEPRHAPKLFTDEGLHLRRSERFQLGFNNLFVFEKP